MNKGKLHRRTFLKRAGFTALSLPSAVAVGKIGDAELVASPEEYGGFLVRRLPKGQLPYQVDDPQLSRFDQRNEVFSRGDWDPIVIDSEEPFDGIEEENIVSNAPGYTRLNYAFGNAS